VPLYYQSFFSARCPISHYLPTGQCSLPSYLLDIFRIGKRAFLILPSFISERGRLNDAGNGAKPTGTADEASAARAVRQMFDAIARRMNLLNHVLSANVDRLWWRRTARRFRMCWRDPKRRFWTSAGTAT